MFYREAKGWLGLREYQVRGKRSLERHWILVFCAYTFILWHWLTGGLIRQWANKPLTTFVETFSAFRTAMFLPLTKPVWALFGLRFCLSPELSITHKLPDFIIYT